MTHETYAGKFGLRPVAFGRRGMVATANPLATLAGVRMLAGGGNAVDAIVAAAAAIGVAEPYMSGAAGCGVLMLSRPGQPPRALSFLGKAPEGATPARLAGAARDVGPLSVAVPGNLAGWARVLADHGTVSLARALEPAIELAEAGPPMTVFDRQMFEEHQGRLNEEGVRTYLHAGAPPAIGARVAQPRLADTFRRIARDGIAALYEGEIAEAIARDMASLGGVLGVRDLKAYPGTLEWSEPLSTTYRGVRVHAPPPPSSAIQVLQTLNGMAGWEVGRMAHLGPEHLAVVAEASRAARMDTDRHVGDPAFVSVPVERLLGAARTEEIRGEMRARLSGARGTAGAVPASRGGSAGTTHLAACDASGLAVNVTQSLGGGFGSGVVVRGTGLALNNALHWTSTDAGHPNVVQPGKTHEWPVAPLHLHRDGAFWATVGTPGSYGILVTSVQVLSNLVDFGLTVQEAIAAPRFRWADEATDPLPARTLRVEARVPEATRRALAERGYALEVLGDFTMRVGGAQAVLRDPETGWLAGGADPRRNGYAMGW
jgi:gamma-glutamyltranspeptidase/glutathione hydrolase